MGELRDRRREQDEGIGYGLERTGRKSVEMVVKDMNIYYYYYYCPTHNNIPYLRLRRKISTNVFLTSTFTVDLNIFLSH